jgi:hypothetical protein
MHKTEAKSTVFFHNGDFSGNVIIRSKEGLDKEIEIPFDDVKALFKEWMRSTLEE